VVGRRREDAIPHLRHYATHKLPNMPELMATEQYVAHYNANPNPFVRTATARDILQKVIGANRWLRIKQNATQCEP